MVIRSRCQCLLSLDVAIVGPLHTAKRTPRSAWLNCSKKQTAQGCRSGAQPQHIGCLYCLLDSFGWCPVRDFVAAAPLFRPDCCDESSSRRRW
eukprot:2953927-Pyramimonas_sp.AAC.1